VALRWENQKAQRLYMVIANMHRVTISATCIVCQQARFIPPNEEGDASTWNSISSCCDGIGR